METNPLTAEYTYQAPIERIWKALTDPSEMKKWYFDIEEFRPELGFAFEFYGENKGKKYVHKCEVTAVEPPSKLAYTWRYEGYTGQSLLTFELFEEGEKRTRLKLTHAGLDSFPPEDKNFAAANFLAGWTSILDQSLRDFVEIDLDNKNSLKKQVMEQFEGGLNIAIKIPKSKYAATVAFYQDILQLEVEERSIVNPTVSRTHRVKFGNNIVWLDCVDNYTHGEVWLELKTPDVSAATAYLAEKGVQTCDELEEIPKHMHWIMDPAGTVFILDKR